MQKQSYLDRFYECFDISPARSPSSIRQVQHLRHQVYCVEAGLKEPTPGEVPLECDEFDHWSVHSLIRHRPSGLMVATVRLVLPRLAQSYEPLPIEKYGGGHAGRAPVRLAQLPRASLAEVSRFAISKSIRNHLAQRAEARLYRKSQLYLVKPEHHYDPREERQLLSQINVGLVAAVVGMSVEQGITHLCAIMEPSLLRLLRRFGIYFKPIGPLVNHYGMRFPCVITLDELLNGMRQKRPEVWEFVVSYAYQFDFLKRFSQPVAGRRPTQGHR